MSFLFASSHLPAVRSTRPELEEEEEYVTPDSLPRSGGVRASSHLEERAPDSARRADGSPAPRRADAASDWLGRLKELAEQQRTRSAPAAPDERPRRADAEHEPDAEPDQDADEAPGAKSEESPEHENTRTWYQPPESGSYHPDPGFYIRPEDVGPASPDHGFYQHLPEGEERGASDAWGGGEHPSSQEWRVRRSDEIQDQPPGGQRGVGPNVTAGSVPASGRTGAFPNSRLFEMRPHPALAGMTGVGGNTAQNVRAQSKFSNQSMNLAASSAPTVAAGMPNQPANWKPQTDNPPTKPSVRATAASPKQSTPAGQPPSTPLSGATPGTAGANAPTPESGDTKPKSNITIEDDHKSPFAQSVQNAMDREIQESPTTAAIVEAVKALPNKVRIVPKPGKGEATVTIAKDGTVTVYINPSELSGATFGHELAHVIQRVAFQNEYDAAPPADDPNNLGRLDRARKKASEALDAIIPVSHPNDPVGDYVENQAVRVTNIVNAERTAAKIKEQFKGRTNVSPEEIAKAFWEAQGLKLEEGKHSNNTFAIPRFTRYGDYDFEHIAKTLGNGITPDMLKRVRNSMGYKAFNIPPPPPQLPPPVRPL